jgi:preprotein translocase subunit SecY
MEKLIQTFKSPQLRKKIFFTVGILVFYRLLAQVSIPGINLEAVQSIFQQNESLNLFSLLTGGSAENFSIVLMGLGPYINASIIVQLLSVIVPKFEELSKDGADGQKKLTSYTRWITFPLAFLQSYGMIALLNSQSSIPIINGISDPSVILPIMLTVSAGSILLMWLGEIITESGIGNGVSLLILVSILSTVSPILGQNIIAASSNPEQLVPVVGLLLLVVLLIAITVIVTESYREIPVSYASKNSKGVMSTLPIKLNQAGMIPIIFAVSIVTFPTILAQLFQTSTAPLLQRFSELVLTHFTFESPSYLFVLFFLIIGFTFFYVSITFKPEQVAENIQRRGGYVPGVRPGKETSEYLANVSSRLNLFGGLFIAGIAVLPVIIQQIAGGNSSSLPLVISGAGILIIVGVISDLIRQVNSYLITNDYNKLY